MSNSNICSGCCFDAMSFLLLLGQLVHNVSCSCLVSPSTLLKYKLLSFSPLFCSILQNLLLDISATKGTPFLRHVELTCQVLRLGPSSGSRCRMLTRDCQSVSHPRWSSSLRNFWWSSLLKELIVMNFLIRKLKPEQLLLCHCNEGRAKLHFP